MGSYFIENLSFFYLSRGRQCVSNGERECDCPSKSGEEKHVLQVHRDLVLPAQVQQERQRVHVQRATGDDGDERREDET
jgi:hypothetical protein